MDQKTPIIRLAFQCVANQPDRKPEPACATVRLAPIDSQDTNGPEREVFHEVVSGGLELNTLKTAIAAKFEPGKRYMIEVHEE